MNPDVIACAHFDGHVVRLWLFRDEGVSDGLDFLAEGPYAVNDEPDPDNDDGGETWFSRAAEKEAWSDFHQREAVLLT